MPGQPLLGVKRVRGCTPTADASMLHVSYTSLEVPSWLYTKNYNQAKSLCFAARRAWPLDQARRALAGELRLFPPATVEGRCTEYHQRGCEVFYPPRATFGFFALCGPEGEARSDYRGPPV